MSFPSFRSPILPAAILVLTWSLAAQTVWSQTDQPANPPTPSTPDSPTPISPSPAPQSKDTPLSPTDPTNEAPTTTQLRKVVQNAFDATHDGWSSDEVILNTQLNDAFIAECQKRLPDTEPKTFNWTLLNMRKAGLLQSKTTRQNHQPLAPFTPIAEIAARNVQDRHHVSTDRMMADPTLRNEFDKTVQEIDKTLDLYSVRKAAFRLRKQRRLRPELIVRIADWGRTIQTFPIAQVRKTPDCIPEKPGIYIFRDATGYLYIGQSDDLRQRLKEHLKASSNFALAQYLEKQTANITIEIHAFHPESRASETMIRRAYESELIASRKPKFNIQP